jgi:alkylation response protein AidB-like acyl-CoA dehydrogenase
MVRRATGRQGKGSRRSLNGEARTVLRIYEGTTQIQQTIIAKQMIRQAGA